ncbi:MAG: site-specific integrase [Planctomycetaceae bacterium]|nr:site-specific integrase [Planctomycetaceae bacterium]
MARPRNTVPRFCVGRTGRAFCKVNGEFISLGRGDNPESRARYAAVLTDLAQGKPVESSRQLMLSVSDNLTVAEFFLQFVVQEVPRYSRSEQHCFKTALRVAREMFGAVQVTEFGPLKLRLVRDAMVAGDPNAKPKPRRAWSRYTVNRQIKRIRAVFRWGVSWEVVPQSVADALSSVRSLACGETAASESTPRLSVPQSDMDRVRKQLRQKHRDIFDLLLLTGARPGEIIGLTTGKIDRSGELWRADLAHHKTAHKGKRRTLFFNPTAQLILRRYLQADPDAKLFKMRRDNFAHVIGRACVRAGVAPFVPHQLRHTVATKLADEVGTEAAQRLLGHSDAAMTEHYSRGAERKAVEAVKKLG